MSSLAISNASPFATALPAPHVFTAYDVDGDAIMADAVTGLPITYGSPVVKRNRAESLDSDSADSHPSKRSRSSSDEADYADMPPLISARPPPAPRKADRPPVDPAADGEDGAGGALRNLAEQMAEAVLQGEPREDASVPPAGDGPQDVEDWCVAVTCSDLALRLDMRHPRVVLNLLRFVTTYNELAPPGEEIHFPLMPPSVVNTILEHSSVRHPPEEFFREINELVSLVNHYSEPEPGPFDQDDDGYSSESSHRSWGRYRY